MSHIPRGRPNLSVKTPDPKTDLRSTGIFKKNNTSPDIFDSPKIVHAADSAFASTPVEHPITGLDAEFKERFDFFFPPKDFLIEMNLPGLL